VLGGDDNARDHHEESRHLAGDGRRAVAHRDVQPRDAQADGDDRVGGRDDRLHRCQEGALLEGVLVKQVADRADHQKDVNRPVAEKLARAVADFRRDELHAERRYPVADAAAQRQRQRPQGLVPRCQGDGPAHHDDQQGDQRGENAQARVGGACRRPPDGQEGGHASRGGGHSGEHLQVRAVAARTGDVVPLAPVPRDNHGEYQVKHQQRLYDREAAEAEGHDLQHEPDNVRPDGQQPQLLPEEVEQDPG
jgi:hypothetical protein